MSFTKALRQRMKRFEGSWRPGMPQDVSAIVLILFNLEVFVRGIDYITGDRSGITTSLTVVEQAMPLQLWGVLLLSSSTLVFCGVLYRREWWIIYGATFNMANYAGLAWGLTLKMLDRGWPIDGFRTPFMFLGVVVFWGLVAYGTKVMMMARSQESIDG